MHIVLLTVSVSIPDSRSLKDKRRVIKSVKERVMARMNVSAAEVGKHDQWQYADLAFVTVSGDKIIAEKRMAELADQLRMDYRMVVMSVHTQIL